MSRQPEQLRQYWLGYRACDAHIYDFGLESASEEYTYGLPGESYAYCKGWLARLDAYRKGWLARLNKSQYHTGR